MAAAVFLLVIFSSFHSVLPSAIGNKTRTFRDCLPLYCGNGEMINPLSTNITRPSSCDPFSVVGCDNGPPLAIRLIGGVGVTLFEFESISNVSLSFITENKEFQGQLNSTLCNSFNNLSLPSLQDASRVLSGLTMFICNRSVVFPQARVCQNVNIHYILENENLPGLSPYCSAVNLKVSSSNYDEIFALLTAKVSFEEYLRIKCHNCLSERGISEAECVSANETEVTKREPAGPKSTHEYFQN